MKFKHLFPQIKMARYNAAVWQDVDSGHIFVITRQVEKAGRNGQPDTGKLILIEMDSSDNVLHEQVIWEPTEDNLWLEDPRALPLSDNSVVIGLTALLRSKKAYKVYPALTRLSTQAWREVLPAITIVETFGPGKNITPLESETYMFRPDKIEYTHKLLMFSFKDMVARKIQDLEFPTDLPWASLKIGTGMPPIWLDDHRALIIFHGMSMVNGKHVYSLGKGFIEKHDNVYHLRVDRNPILTPEDFVNDKGKYLVSELHPKQKRVVYACGGVIKKGIADKLFLYVNVGDKAIFEVEFPLSELTQDLV